MKYLQRALSLRVLFGSLFVSLVAAVLLSLLWEPLAYAFIPIFGLLYASAILNEDNAITCPYCRKRVKLGAGTCSHCGRDVSEP